MTMSDGVPPFARMIPWTPELDRELGGDGERLPPCRPVVIESPLAGNVELHQRYLDACIRDCIERGETPYASHRMLVGPLDDLDAAQRMTGMLAGFHMAEALAQLGAPRVVYVDCGVSGGMGLGIQHAERIGQRVERRTVPGWRP
jgi:hypothetical protein